MVGMYLSAAAICASAGAIGQLVCVLGGASRWSWLAPGAGLAALLCLASIGVRLPGNGWTAFALIVVCASGAAAVLWRRSALGGIGLEGLLVGLAVLALTALPFYFNRRFGLLGAGVNDDLGFHLAWADALALGREPVAISGYPLGPHALAAALARPLGSILSAFSGLLVAIPLLTALVALAGLSDLDRPRRIVAGAVVGLPYLAAAYFAEASFKEPLMALLLLTFVLGLHELGERPAWRGGLVPGLAGVGILFVYSFDGIAWPLAAGVAWLAVELASHRRDAGHRLRELGPGVVCAAVVVAVGALVQVGRLVAAYKGVGSPGKETGAGGNFFRNISPLTLTGGWNAFEFRLPPESGLRADLLAAVAGLGAIYGAWWWSVRRQLAVPAAIAACLAIYVYTRQTRLPYYSAKALVIAAPLVMLMSSRAVLAGWPRWSMPRLRAGPSLVRAAAVVAFVAVVGYSSVTQLRYASVGSLAHANELIALRQLLSRGPTIFLSGDDYARWELFGVSFASMDPYGPCRERSCCEGCGTAPHVPPGVPHRKPVLPHTPIDFDTPAPGWLDGFRYAVAARTAYASRPPTTWRILRRGRFYDVWERHGAGPPRSILPQERSSPGAVLDCRAPGVLALSRRAWPAGVRPAPVTGGFTQWRPLPRDFSVARYPGYTLLRPGSTVSQTLALPSGGWELALQYSSSVDLTVSAGARSWHVPAAPEPQQQLWRVGRLPAAGGPLTVSVTAARPRRGAALRDVALGTLAADRGFDHQRTMSLSRACGRYVDWYESR
jgi:hypothetical protein